MSITIALCEDEQNIREEIAELILCYDTNYRLESYVSADALINSGKDYDIYILDIQMPGISGMELAENIRNKQFYPGPVIIFITAFKEYMHSAFDVQAYHFLTKPIDEDKFHEVLKNAAVECQRRSKPEHIVVKASGIAHSVCLSDIIYVESIGKKVAIRTPGGIIESYGKISEIAATLLDCPMFFRCHRCYIVNMEYIKSFSAKAISLTNGQQVNLAREKHQSFLEAYARYAMK